MGCVRPNQQAGSGFYTSRSRLTLIAAAEHAEKVPGFSAFSEPSVVKLLTEGPGPGWGWVGRRFSSAGIYRARHSKLAASLVSPVPR